MRECSKSVSRRLSDSNFIRRYFVGKGIDIGGKPDPLSDYKEFFPLAESIRTWDLQDGDAQHLRGIQDNSLDFVHSSHCLEHLTDPLMALRNWIRVIVPGGHIVFTVPDEDLYEQGVFPSTFNGDHKWTFTIFKTDSWCERSLNILDMVRDLGGVVAPIKIELLNANYRYSLPRQDQSLSTVSECGIEVVLRKPLPSETSQEKRGNNPGRGKDLTFWLTSDY